MIKDKIVKTYRINFWEKNNRTKPLLSIILITKKFFGVVIQAKMEALTKYNFKFDYRKHIISWTEL